MASTLVSPVIAGSFGGQLTGGALPATINGVINHQVANQLVVGSGAGQVNKVYSAAFSIVSGTPLALDLTSILDPFQQSNNFSNVRGIFISNDDTVTGHDLTPFGGTNGLLAVSTILVYANGGSLPIDFGAAGLTVDGTHKIVQITAATGTVTGKITIFGR